MPVIDYRMRQNKFIIFAFYDIRLLISLYFFEPALDL